MERKKLYHRLNRYCTELKNRRVQVEPLDREIARKCLPDSTEPYETLSASDLKQITVDEYTRLLQSIETALTKSE